MWLPKTRSRWEEDSRRYRVAPEFVLEETEVICRNTDWLLARLYEPDAETGAHASPLENGMRDEAINWGDLSCSDVRQFTDGRWQIVLEEASPGQCPSLCEYVRHWLTKWGWEVEVATRW